MSAIQVIQGTAVSAEKFIEYLKKKNITCKYVTTLYSPCWIISFKIALPRILFGPRIVWYLAGVDELHLTPGKVARVPLTETVEVEPISILEQKIKEEEACQMAWDESKRWIIKRFRAINQRPSLLKKNILICYKPLYLLRIDTPQSNGGIYKVLDSLTGDLENIVLKK